MPKIPHQPDVNVGTSGHVDHGKSTIVDAITGVWTSAHSEELRRGITIKVGYADAAFYKCPNCQSPQNYSTSKQCPNCKSEGILQRVLSFVDVPGHESLMANMLSGASLTDGSILVIAANEDVPRPQTREHLLALEMLGTKQVVIAQNKIDLVTREEAKQNHESIKDFVSGIFILLENQYAIGDKVKIGSFEGRVLRITMRSTVLKDEEGKVYYMSNGSITNVVNLSQQKQSS